LVFAPHSSAASNDDGDDGDAFALPSFAKINLTLRVLGRRADGYHELRTVFQTITLRDRLTFRALGGGRLELSCDAADVPADETNLVHRAAVLLREHYGVRRGARVEIGKVIPAGGGLGGGSSNAAVALVGLARLWEVETDGAELAALGARLGADVPFFLAGGTAEGSGRGDVIRPLPDAPPLRLLVVTPPVAVSTAEAYKSLNAPALTKADRAVNFYVSHEAADFSGSLRDALLNDFEPAVFRDFPEIEHARAALLRAGARAALLSGSGASVFGVFDGEREVERAAAALRSETRGRVFACSTVGRAEYRAAFGDCAALLLRGTRGAGTDEIGA
jgi:4-diphosphocytidyl-2-C-methyl-D-erythritol kinase